MRFHVPSALVAALVLSAAAAAQGAPVDLSTVQFNGSANSPASGVIRLTDGANLLDANDPGSNIGEVGSAFIGTPFSADDGFLTSFTFTLTNTGFTPLADGLTFMFQGNDPFATGDGGGGVGVMDNAIGVAFQSWDNNHATIFTNHNVFGGQPLGNFNLGDQDDVVQVSISYLAHTLSYSAFNVSTGQSVGGSRSVNLAALGPDIYLGFTGATGLSYSIQDVADWDLEVRTGAGAVPEPAAWALMIGGFGAAGAMLRRRRRALV